MDKISYPMKVTLLRKKNGRTTAQVTIKQPDGRIYHGHAHDTNDIDIETTVLTAVYKVQGRMEALDEANDPEAKTINES